MWSSKGEGEPMGQCGTSAAVETWSALKQYSKKETTLVQVKRGGQRQVVWRMGPLGGGMPLTA